MMQEKLRLFLIMCPFCGEYRVIAAPLNNAYWCLSEDCRTSEKRNGVRALIWEKGNLTSNARWIIVDVEDL